MNHIASVPFSITEEKDSSFMICISYYLPYDSKIRDVHVPIYT